MDKLFIKNKVYILTAIGALIIFGLVWYVLIPQYNKYQMAKSTYNQKMTELRDLNDRKATIAAKSDEIKKVTEQLNKFSNLIPAKMNEADLIVELTSLAEQSGVSIKNYAFSAEDKKTSQGAPAPASNSDGSKKPIPKAPTIAAESSLTKISIPIQAIGSFAAIETYIDRLLSLERIFSIDAISFSSAVDGQDNASISAITYSL